MEHHMFHHPATQAHLATLRDRGAAVVPPESGRLASGAAGDGRLAPTETILGAARAALGRRGPLAGRRLVVTAGGTREPLDPVRYLGNRSSGTMGYALAQAAIDRGAAVTLVSGPTALPVPVGVHLVRVESAHEMQTAVAAAASGADALLMAAAVADFRPAAAAARKIKKGQNDDGPTLHLVRNPDILASVDSPGLVKIGFAAETEDLEANATAKLASKGLAMIVANDAVATIGSADSTATLILPDRPPERLPPMPKGRLADLILDRLTPMLATARSPDGDRG
jgi:phosphopantothenoylcysteine decarboxylase/phosphopantothenate--cysteine ligase